MKKIISVLLCAMMVFSLTACGGGNVSNVIILEWKSEAYTEKDIESAIEVATNYFKKEFSGCTLTSITYAGDEKTIAHVDWATRNNADEVIVLISSFDVDASGGDGSLNPNSTYDNWMWILVRTNGGKWKHVDHGY